MHSEQFCVFALMFLRFLLIIVCCFYALGETNVDPKDSEEPQGTGESGGIQNKGIYDTILCYISASIRFNIEVTNFI